MVKDIKKIVTVMLAVMMVAAMSITAFAADSDLAGDGIVGDFTTADTPLELNDGSKVVLRKEITAFNPETSVVNAPTITYSYSIAAGSSGKDIYDVDTAHNPAANAHATTKAGVSPSSVVVKGSVDGGTNWTNDNLVFTPSVQLNASSAGTKNGDFKVEFDFSSVTFPGAGVYRYAITETCTNETKAAAGIKDGSISNTRYMDVYVDGTQTIYGYVLMTNDNSIDARSGATTNTVADAGKTEGFVAAGSDTADQYYTFNFEVGKNVVNDSYSELNHHQFPFTVTLTNASVTANVLPIMTVSTNATQTALSAAPIAGTWTPTIADDATVKYVGIPCGTTVTIKERNDVTGVTYSSESTNADTNASQKYIDTGADSNNAVINCGSTALSAATENHTSTANKMVLFTNTLTQISPTGIVIRFAIPFALLIMGLALYLVMKGNKKASVTR